MGLRINFDFSKFQQTKKKLQIAEKKFFLPRTKLQIVSINISNRPCLNEFRIYQIGKIFLFSKNYLGSRGIFLRVINSNSFPSFPSLCFSCPKTQDLRNFSLAPRIHSPRCLNNNSNKDTTCLTLFLRRRSLCLPLPLVLLVLLIWVLSSTRRCPRWRLLPPPPPLRIWRLSLARPSALLPLRPRPLLRLPLRLTWYLSWAR